MASNNSVSSNDALHANIRVKIEPGTSESSMSISSAPSTSSVPISERVTSIKMEPGLPTTTQRLTSFRLLETLRLKSRKKCTRQISMCRGRRRSKLLN